PRDGRARLPAAAAGADPAAGAAGARAARRAPRLPRRAHRGARAGLTARRGAWQDAAAMPLLLVDLDNTLADRDAAFHVWLDDRLTEWAPVDGAAARAFVVEQDADGFRPRTDFLAAVRERLGLAEPVEALLADYRRLTLAGFPALDPQLRARLA